MHKKIIEIRNVSAFIPGDRERRLALRNISLGLHQGEHLAILGPNGSGKSTLLRLMAGRLRPAAGEVIWHIQGTADRSAITGQEITGLVSPMEQEKLQALAPQISVQSFLLSRYGAALEPDLLDVADALGASHLLKEFLGSLSQGQLRLALLIGELLSKPRLLLLDEWDDGLDQAKRELALQYLEQKKEEMAIVFTTHRSRSLPRWVTRAVGLNQGELVSATIKPSAPSYAHAPQPPFPPAGDPVFILKDVDVYIDRRHVLHQINWLMRRGEHWLIAGSNGSGKSTFLRLLAGDEFVASGGSLECHARSSQRQLATLAEKRAIIAHVSDLSQAQYGYALTALELVLSGIDNSIGLWTGPTASGEQDACRLLEFFFPGQDLKSRSIRQLSTGELRKLFLARALILRPEVLLLDEPCTGLDPESRENFLGLLDKIVHEGWRGCKPQVVFVSHNAEDRPEFISRMATMRDGRLEIEQDI